MMKINTVVYDEDKTDSFINLMGIVDKPVAKRISNGRYYSLENIKKRRKKFGNLSSKGIMKKVFGQQQKTVQYTNRNWVWTVSNESESATLYLLANVEGMSIEYNYDSDRSDLIELYFEFVSRVIE